jgi:hypothetical protein
MTDGEREEAEEIFQAVAIKNGDPSWCCQTFIMDGLEDLHEAQVIGELEYVSAHYQLNTELGADSSDDEPPSIVSGSDDKPDQSKIRSSSTIDSADDRSDDDGTEVGQVSEQSEADSESQEESGEEAEDSGEESER